MDRMENRIVLGNVPNSLSKMHLKILIRELCHIHVPLKWIDKHHDGSGTKIIIITIGENNIPEYAIRRLQKFGKEILPNVIVHIPESVTRQNYIGLPENIRQKYGMPPYHQHHLNTAKAATRWLHYELFLKYPQLNAIDLQYHNDVSRALALIIVHRVIDVMNEYKRTNKFVRDTTSVYRNIYKHNTDFELVTSQIKKVEQKYGVPLTTYTEEDLLKPTPPPEEVEKERQRSDENFKEINEKLKAYIDKLDSDIKPEDSVKTVNRKRVRQTMKQFTQFFPQMAPFVSFKDLSETPDWIGLYIIGEPSLPSGVSSLMNTLLKLGVTTYSLKKNKYSVNAAKVYIARAHYDKLMELDGGNPEYDLPYSKNSTLKLYIRHENNINPQEKSLAQAYGILTNWAAKKIIWNQGPLLPHQGPFEPRPTQFGPSWAPNRFPGPVPRHPRHMGPRGYNYNPYRYTKRI